MVGSVEVRSELVCSEDMSELVSDESLLLTVWSENSSTRTEVRYATAM